MAWPGASLAVLAGIRFATLGLTLKGMNLTGAAYHPVTLGVILGLFLGKPMGLTLFSYLAVKKGSATLFYGVRWSHIFGVGILGV